MIELLDNPWIRLTVVILIVFIVSKIVSKILIVGLKKFAAFTKTKRDDELVEKIETPLVLVLSFIALRFGLLSLADLIAYLRTIVLVVDTLTIIVVARIVVIAVYLIFEIWSSGVILKKNINVDDQIIVALEKSLGFVIYIISLGYILTVWEIDIWPVLGSLGVAGIAFAFALQETLKNVFGGIQLILDKNFKKGDIIELSTGTSGKIYDITLRSTRIRTWDNKLIIIPNGVMANDVITNITKPDKSRRVSVHFGVDYGSDPDYVKAICLEEVESIENVERDDPAPRIIFKSMGDSALIFEARYWVKNLDNYIDAREDGTTKIYERLNDEGIGIPFPQMTVWTNDMGKYKEEPYKKKKYVKGKAKK